MSPSNPGFESSLESSSVSSDPLRQEFEREASRANVSSNDRLKAFRKKVERLAWKHDQIATELKATQTELEAIEQYLSVSEQVTDALDVLSQKLFEEVLDLLKEKLSAAILEVLEQPVQFHAEASFKRGAASVEFSVARNGNTEDVNRGQGGSVQNILSVGLRMFALARLDEQEHRRFLVLDEQDCWLRPELVENLVKIVSEAARELNFQVIMISHHDIRLFQKYADKIYYFEPKGEDLHVSEFLQKAIETDQE